MDLLNFLISPFYYIKNKLNPPKIEKYKWIEIQLDSSLGYEWVKAKFYATKNWVEVYAYMFGNNDDVDRKEERLIIPMWKVVSYGEGFMKVLSSKTDYKRYKRWNKKWKDTTI